MSKKFVILPDNTCDLDESIRREYDIEFVPGFYTVAGKDFLNDMTWNSISRSDFYSALRKHPEAYSSAPPNIAQYEEYFEKFAKQGMDILVLTISSKMSGSFGFAQSAQKSVNEKYPDCKIMIIDSRKFSSAMGLLCVHASIMRSEGKTIEEVYKTLEDTKLCYHQSGWCEDLPFVAKMGRINGAAAFFGTLISIKALGDIDVNGMTTVIGKAKGDKSGYKAALDYIEKTAVDIKNQVMIVCHTDREEKALELKRMIEERFNPKKVLFTSVYPSCGINMGPGMLTCYYKGEPITEGLEKEKSIMSEILGK